MRRETLLCIGLYLCSCGGGALPSESPKQESPAPNYRENTTTTQPASDGSQTNAVPQTPQYAEPPGREREMTNLNRAQAQVEASLGDCATACRALASMESAASHICQLDTTGSDCASANQRVSAARARVQHACGGCSH